jgi:lysophospholipase L1-like esterase
MLDYIVNKTFDFLATFPPLIEDNIPYYAAQFVLLVTIFHTLRTLVILIINKQLAFVSTAYNSLTESDEKILILGDSTAVGTGASRVEDTLGGRLARDFRNAQIVNLAINGSPVSSMSKQIEPALSQQYALVLISSGGNDTWRLSRMKTIAKNLQYVLTEAKRISNHRVIVLINNNVGFGPFPRPIRNFLKYRNQKIVATISEIAGREQVPVIDLFTSDSQNPFLEKPSELLASDGIHPSSKGYAIWYNRMWRIMVERGYHYKQ